MDWLVDLFLISFGLVEFILRVVAFTVICALVIPAVLLAMEDAKDLVAIEGELRQLMNVKGT